MIYVSQGSLESIGLEIFIKSVLCLSREQQRKFKLVCHKSSFEKTLISTGLEHFGFSIRFIDEKSKNTTLSSLTDILEIITKNDLLITLPAVKKDFVYRHKVYSGHTEFFRQFYGIQEIPMLFFGPRMNILLLTDHIPLKEVEKLISVEQAVTKVSKALDHWPRPLPRPRRIIFSGINPHIGEQGLMGSDEELLTEVLIHLEAIYPSQTFLGPFSGDIAALMASPNDLIVYPAHDQGLSLFKGVHQFFGMQATLGLPFLRLSVDHGVASDLYLKNRAYYNGMSYLLQNALKLS